MPEGEKRIKIGSIVKAEIPGQNGQGKNIGDFKVLSIGVLYLTPQDRLNGRELPRQDLHCVGTNAPNEVVLISIDNIMIEDKNSS